jgi:hypothetical protein
MAANTADFVCRVIGDTVDLLAFAMRWRERCVVPQLPIK